jgi:hypothetical protein
VANFSENSSALGRRDGFSKKIFPIAGLCLSLHEFSKPFGAKGKGVLVAKGSPMKIGASALAWVQYPNSFFST